ncbi:hypothetical protein ACMYZ5_05770 [Bacteroides sp. KG68]|uniref:hypothetical protein n=1 Tax=unclassified Bacteroides TaxID=2646097 RepID=UPI003D7F714C
MLITYFGATSNGTNIRCFVTERLSMFYTYATVSYRSLFFPFSVFSIEFSDFIPTFASEKGDLLYDGRLVLFIGKSSDFSK